jgi:hypothetical protein
VRDLARRRSWRSRRGGGKSDPSRVRDGDAGRPVAGPDDPAAPRGSADDGGSPRAESASTRASGTAQSSTDDLGRSSCKSRTGCGRTAPHTASGGSRQGAGNKASIPDKRDWTTRARHGTVTPVCCCDGPLVGPRTDPGRPTDRGLLPASEAKRTPPHHPTRAFGADDAVPGSDRRVVRKTRFWTTVYTCRSKATKRRARPVLRRRASRWP